MILVDSADRSKAGLDARVVLAGQLTALGHRAGLDAATIAQDISTDLTYQLAPLLLDVDDVAVSRVIVIAGETVADEMLSTLRGYALPPDVPVQAVGRLGDAQARIDLRLKLSYALGREPELIEVDAWHGKGESLTATIPLAGSETIASAAPGGRLRLTIVLSSELINDPLTLPMLAALSHLRAFRLRMVAATDLREAIRAVPLAELEVYGPEELLPRTFAAMSDIALFIGATVPGGRAVAFGFDMLQSGRVVIDGTLGALFPGAGAPALRGPGQLGAVATYLEQTVLPNLAEIRRQVQVSPWLATSSARHLAARLGLPELPQVPQVAGSRTVFLPTNGSGLGHAQRCLQIAAAMRDADIAFAAFPSCIPMIEDAGHPCLPLVQRTEDHTDRSANDLLNSLRLQRNLGPGDTLVFDGGYVFPSVYRTILEKALIGIWIRRGLWQPGQITPTALRREPVFRRVIVPQEAFDELNEDYSFGPRVSPVGPVVQQVAQTLRETAALRRRLARQFGRRVDELVVTMLGGGVAADRLAQTLVACGAAERRPGCLHLVVVWPGSRVAPAVLGWKNTAVVQTRHAARLCLAADLVISAAGYNSFHECLYHAVPAIFVPQMAPFMDDQTRRARAASDRGLAETVTADELLRLDREIGLFLDGGKAADIRTRLAQAMLPPRGTAAAAALIEEVAR